MKSRIPDFNPDTGTDTSPVHRRAIFLDRDGVINRPLIRDGKPFPPVSVDEFEILPGVSEACEALKRLGFPPGGGDKPTGCGSRDSRS